MEVNEVQQPGHFDLRPQSQLGECSRQHDEQVIAITLELLVGMHAGNHVQITSRARTRGIGFLRWRLAFAGDPNGLTIMDPGGNLDFESTIDRNTAHAAAIDAAFGDDLSTPLAIGTGRDHSEHATKTGLRHLSAAPAS